MITVDATDITLKVVADGLFALLAHTHQWTLTANDHRSRHQTVAEYLDCALAEDPSDSCRAACIAADQVYVLQVYPLTSVGFEVFVAPSIEALHEKLAARVDGDPRWPRGVVEQSRRPW